MTKRKSSGRVIKTASLLALVLIVLRNEIGSSSDFVFLVEVSIWDIHKSWNFLPSYWSPPIGVEVNIQIEQS
jgi:hypothetical protein